MVLGVLLNPWTLGRLVARDGRISSPAVIAGIVAAEVLAIGWGLVTLRRRRSDLVLNLNLLLVSVGLGAPVLGELVFRLGIALHVAALRNPALYADWYSDDDYWKLQQEWQGRWKHEGPAGVQPGPTFYGPLHCLSTAGSFPKGPRTAGEVYSDSTVLIGTLYINPITVLPAGDAALGFECQLSPDECVVTVGCLGVDLSLARGSAPVHC